MRLNFLNFFSINFGTINLISFLILIIVFSSSVTAAELPSECKTQSVNCFVINIDRKAYAFYWKKDQLFHQKKNVATLRINGQVVGSSNPKFLKKPLKWNFKNRILFLNSEEINLSIDFKRDRLVKINKKAVGNLGYEFQSIENAVKVESSKRITKRNQEKAKAEAEQRLKKQNDFLKKAFNELTIEQKKKIQSMLILDGHYNKNVDGKWGKGTLDALRGFISVSSFYFGTKLDPPNHISQAKNLLKLIENFETEKAEAERKRREAEAEKKRRNLVAKSFGYKDIKIYMTSDEISSAANCTLRTDYFTKCYGMDNIKFRGEFRTSSEFKKPVLNLLILDMGPLDAYSWASFLMNWREADPESANVYENMRTILDKKYSLDFEFSERDVTFFEKGERDILRMSYESGQVRLEVRNQKDEYGYKNTRLYLIYSSQGSGDAYLKSFTPEKPKASDF